MGESASQPALPLSAAAAIAQLTQQGMACWSMMRRGPGSAKLGGKPPAAPEARETEAATAGATGRMESPVTGAAFGMVLSLWGRGSERGGTHPFPS